MRIVEEKGKKGKITIYPNVRLGAKEKEGRWKGKRKVSGGGVRGGGNVAKGEPQIGSKFTPERKIRFEYSLNFIKLIIYVLNKSFY